MGCISAYHQQTDSVSGYNFKTFHEIPEKKLDDELEAKLAVLNKMLNNYQQEQKKEVTLKSKVQEEESEKEGEPKDVVPNYEFGYGVKDLKTGDHKDQWEKRVGGTVKGVYKFAEADGTQRVVEYEADDKKGFEAKVTNVAQGEGGAEKEFKHKPKLEGEIAHSYSYLKKY